MKRIYQVLGITILVVVAAALGGFLWLRTSLPPAQVFLADSSLDAPVSVYFDDDDIPYIFAQNSRDAAFALGFTHAQNRLWQMDFQRRVGAGRLSEILGMRTLGVDRFMRTLGLYRAAETALEGLAPDTRAVLDAYARGVNAWLDQRQGALPIEYVLLRHQPEPWKAADSLVWGKLMALRLSGNFRAELQRLRLVAKGMPEDRIRQLWPAYPKNAPVTGIGDHAAITPIEIDRLLTGLTDVRSIAQGASNAWAIGGAKTASGKPILANDPHLGFAAPILWYLARVKTPSGELAGATVPGVPFHILGHNGAIAWGITTTQSDLQDLFLETPVEGRPDYYLTPDGTVAFENRVETIRVDGQPDVNISIRSTRNGPVISDLPNYAGADVFSLRATFLSPDDTSSESIFRLNQARDLDGFLAAMRGLVTPQLNVVYADTIGHFGFISPGRVPLRRSGVGFLPGIGRTGANDWRGAIPFAALPQAFDLPSGFVANANNKVVGDDYPHFITGDWAAPYRAQRITRELKGSTDIGMDDTAKLQLDTVSLAAQDLVPLMTTIAGATPRQRAALARLRTWNGLMDANRSEPAIFAAWLRALNRALYSDDLGTGFPAAWRTRPLFVANTLRNGDQHWCDNKSTIDTESCDTILTQSLATALDDLTDRFGTPDITDWAWGELHQAAFDHQVLGQIPLLRRVANLRIPSPGGDFTVNRGMTRINSSKAPHAHVHGSGYRGIYDLSDLDSSRFAIATGQSGNPLSSHYRDFLARWVTGQYVEMSKTRDELESSSPRRILLAPALSEGKN